MALGDFSIRNGHGDGLSKAGLPGEFATNLISQVPALAQLAPDVQWVESYVAADKTFCVYLAKDEDVIRKHAEISGFPATTITPVRKMIDPTTEKDT